MKSNNEEWRAMFERLQAYKHEYNTCNVSKRCRTDPKLGHWVHYQRIMYKAEKLCQDRKDLLESIGFVWSERKTSKITREYTSWDERFQELKKFQSIHGHSHVPRKGKDAALGRWVKWQRWNRTLLDRGESSALTKQKIKLLNSIGFSWGYQRVPPQQKTTAANTASTELSFEVSIEPLPYMPTVSTTSTNRDSRTFLTPCFQESLGDITRSNRILYSSYGEPNNFNEDFNPPRSFNHQDNFVRPLMPLSKDDSKMIVRKVSSSQNAHKHPPQFQGYTDNNFQGMHSSSSFQMEEPLKINTDQFPVSTVKVWKCSVCRFATFDTFDEAVTHEKSCSSFCHACAA